MAKKTVFECHACAYDCEITAKTKGYKPESRMCPFERYSNVSWKEKKPKKKDIPSKKAVEARFIIYKGTRYEFTTQFSECSKCDLRNKKSDKCGYVRIGKCTDLNMGYSTCKNGIWKKSDTTS